MSSEFQFIHLFLITILLAGLIFPGKTKAQVETTGFIRNYNAVQTLPAHRILIGSNRFRLNLDNSFAGGEWVVSNEVRNFYTEETDSLKFRLREAYADLYFEKSDLRIGRQMISWGRAEGTVIADILTPLDLTEFLTQEFADLRTGVTALSYTRYFGSDYLQLVVNPVFQPNETPRPGGRWFPRTYFASEIPIRFENYRTDPRLADIQTGVRLALRTSLRYDLDIGYLYWNHPNPEYHKDLVLTESGDRAFRFRETFARSHILFYSGTLNVADGLLFTSESAFYTSRSFDYLTDDLRNIDYENPSPAEQALLNQAFGTNRDGFLKNRPWFIGMAGLQFDWSKWTVSAQFVDEYIVNYDAQILQKEHYNYVTLRLQRSFLHDKLSFRGFGRYNLNGNDFWINPEVTYQGIDNIEASAGTQLFGGAEPDDFYGHISFDNYAQNSFGYVRFTAYF